MRKKGGEVLLEMIRTCRESFMKTEWVSIIREVKVLTGL
jgi:hypothetical protein